MVLIGPPGAGKSAVGPLLADRLGVGFRDTDAEVAAAAGKPVSDIFIESGEEAFREFVGYRGHHRARRAAQLRRGAGARQRRRPRCRGPVPARGPAHHFFVRRLGTVARRVGLDRPRVVVPGNPRGRLRTMLGEREAIYQRLAAITVPTNNLDPGELADQIAAEITKK